MKKIILLSIVLAFASCKPYVSTAYKVSTEKRNFYCEQPTFRKDTCSCTELLRNKKPNEFKIPYKEIESVTFRGKKYNWK